MELLSVGYTHSLTQNVVYGLPSVAVWIQSNSVLEISLDNSTFVAVAASTTGTVVVAPFVRNTTSTTNVTVVKKYN